MTETNYPYIALDVDSTSLEVFRPTGRFEEVKSYWDAKNCIYALKKEVAVMASAPHYALFVQKGYPGSVHDYTIFKESYNSYAEYLRKTTQEKQALLADNSDNRWAILGDRGYVGQEKDTPSVRRIFITKNAVTQAAQTRNNELSTIRVHVEQWFGRLKKLWKFVRSPYKLDHADFDNHFMILTLLTNEHIRNYSLNEEDVIYYRNLIVEQKKKYDQVREKRKSQADKYRTKRRRRLQELE